MRKLIVVLTLAVVTVAAVPRPAAAQGADCTEQYVKCLNDSWYLTGWLQKLADIECFADYSACIARGFMKV